MPQFKLNTIQFFFFLSLLFCDLAIIFFNYFTVSIQFITSETHLFLWNFWVSFFVLFDRVHKTIKSSIDRDLLKGLFCECVCARARCCFSTSSAICYISDEKCYAFSMKPSHGISFAKVMLKVFSATKIVIQLAETLCQRDLNGIFSVTLTRCPLHHSHLYMHWPGH